MWATIRARSRLISWPDPVKLSGLDLGYYPGQIQANIRAKPGPDVGYYQDQIQANIREINKKRRIFVHVAYYSVSVAYVNK